MAITEQTIKDLLAQKKQEQLDEAADTDKKTIQSAFDREWEKEGYKGKVKILHAKHHGSGKYSVVSKDDEENEYMVHNVQVKNGKLSGYHMPTSTHKSLEDAKNATNESLDEAADTVYTITISRRGKKREDSGTLAELIDNHSYTLEVGKSYEHEKGNAKINLKPKTIKDLIKNLNNAKSNAAANGASDTFYDIADKDAKKVADESIDESGKKGLIIGKGHDGMYKLVHEKSGEHAAIGDEVTDFRGNKTTLKGGTAPHKPGANGYAEVEDGGRYYAGVHGLMWKKINKTNEELDEDWIPLAHAKPTAIEKVKTKKSGGNYLRVVSVDQKSKEFYLVTPKQYDNGDIDKAIPVPFSDVVMVSTDDFPEGDEKTGHKDTKSAVTTHKSKHNYTDGDDDKDESVNEAEVSTDKHKFSSRKYRPDIGDEHKDITHVFSNKDKLDGLGIPHPHSEDGEYGPSMHVTVTNKSTGKSSHHSVYQSGYDEDTDKPIISIRSIGHPRDVTEEHTNALVDHLGEKIGKQSVKKVESEDDNITEADMSYDELMKKRKPIKDMTDDELQTHLKTSRVGPGSATWKKLIRNEVDRRKQNDTPKKESEDDITEADIHVEQHRDRDDLVVVSKVNHRNLKDDYKQGDEINKSIIKNGRLFGYSVKNESVDE